LHHASARRRRFIPRIEIREHRFSLTDVGQHFWIE
jgi:hypothetical protein